MVQHGKWQGCKIRHSLKQDSCKVAPALACGCTMVLKPSELAPLSAQLFAEIIHDSGLPAGVFNMVTGDGPGVGTALSSHPGIEMVSLTGSTRAGILVSKAAADTVKRVTLELAVSHLILFLKMPISIKLLKRVH